MGGLYLRFGMLQEDERVILWCVVQVFIFVVGFYIKGLEHIVNLKFSL